MLFLRHLCLIMYFGISILYAQDINEVSNNIPMSPQSTTTPTTQPMIPLNETRKLELAGDILAIRYGNQRAILTWVLA